MLKILIVDDEDLTRKGMIKIISKTGDFTVAGEAANGLEALAFIENNPVDVVITDMQMPLMDGSELVNKLEINYPFIRKVVLSGYNDFNYVRATMRSGAADYLLKPVDNQELINLLKKIETDISYENEKKQSEINIKIKLRESFPLLKDEFVYDFLSGKQFSKNEIEDKFEYFNIQILQGNYCVLIISIDNYRYIIKKSGQEEAKLHPFIIRNITEEILSGKTSFLSCVKDGDFIAAVSVPGGDLTGFYTLIDDLFSKLSQYSGCRFTISMGVLSEALKDSYLDAEAKLKYRFYSTKSACIHIKSANYSQNNINDKLESCKEKFITSLKNCIETINYSLVNQIINDYCRSLSESEVDPVAAVKFFTEACLKVHMDSHECDCALINIYGREYSFVKSLEVFDTMDMMKAYVSDVFENIIKNVEKTRGIKNKKIVEVVKAYLQKNYYEDISLNMISQITYLSPSYVCDLFKNESGESIINYLTRIRIEKAKILLKDIKVKTYEVGQQVGYEDPTYFSKVFKKAVGVSPSEYRNMI